MQTKSNGIQKIKYGEVHCFYPLKFESKESFEGTVVEQTD